MNTITVSVAQLLDTLRANKATHHDTFVKAMTVFRIKAIEVLDEQIASIHKGGLPDKFLRLPIPEEHTEDYDRAIQMLEWHTEPTIELSMGEFTQYVQDNWGWRQNFLTNTASYANAR